MYALSFRKISTPRPQLQQTNQKPRQVRLFSSSPIAGKPGVKPSQPPPSQPPPSQPKAADTSEDVTVIDLPDVEVDPEITFNGKTYVNLDTALESVFPTVETGTVQEELSSLFSKTEFTEAFIRASYEAEHATRVEFSAALNQSGTVKLLMMEQARQDIVNGPLFQLIREAREAEANRPFTAAELKESSDN